MSNRIERIIEDKATLALTARERARLPYTRAVLAAMVWLREVPEDIE